MIRQKYLQGLECRIYNEKIVWKQNGHLDLDTVERIHGHTQSWLFETF